MNRKHVYHVITNLCPFFSPFPSNSCQPRPTFPLSSLKKNSPLDPKPHVDPGIENKIQPRQQSPVVNPEKMIWPKIMKNIVGLIFHHLGSNGLFLLFRQSSISFSP
ncbi:uncharacterized protein KLLA0_C16819g [Kluyveromyces lactis]|uniref:KLLA0C16819p n=1 Tax=Kluyveromyces lactis (strain ATCC 8585 / CBS 2359 / DSM 70799 / NBRC 1267 / NRRL Y-1140 / WM37) TaxID=284590 RepID=Q6CSY7_KLULA|nr:uncharacterized protein KLLA0_C16819g [Kluyveromyces lactis]CAH01803.1 KLLA0C16819p [Kluyveromyces lactis]|eukprot:XP_452952.1 uncharacterized protein KLLA0_C16819g [Kluyveromyces lactis]